MKYKFYICCCLCFDLTKSYDSVHREIRFKTKKEFVVDLIDKFSTDQGNTNRHILKDKLLGERWERRLRDKDRCETRRWLLSVLL